ncbi:MAG: NAD-dependent epimerase/dehydratase family protein [Endomicrobiales bacterium]
MKVLLTGANGFVGSHIAEALIENGHQLVCMVRRTSDLRWLKEVRAEYRYCDVTDPALLPGAVKEADVIVHSAGVLRAQQPQAYYAVNQEATRSLAEAVLTHNPSLKKFIYLSSQAAMGPSSGLHPKSAEEPENPVSDYGKSKLAGEKALKILEGKIPYTILRPASVYGPRDKDIFIFFRLVSLGLRPRPLKDRYFQLLFVKDLARAVLAVMRSDAANGKTYVLAEEKPYSWSEVGAAIARAVGKKTLPLPLPDLAFHLTSLAAETAGALSRRPAVLNRQKVKEMLQPYWLADPGPARKDLSLDFTKLDFGAKITYQWYKANKWF